MIGKINWKLVAIVVLALALRTFKLAQYPIGLYSDEAVFGYNAYSLIQEGRDEYGRFWPISFESFGDWKPPMQGWLAIPFVWLLGLNETAVRLPSALLGTATVVIIFLLAKIFFKSERTALLTALLLAINPWHIFMSRIAMLVSVEVFFISSGVLFLLKGLNDTIIPAQAGIYLNRLRVKHGMTSWWWILSAVSFSGAIYSYYGSRITAPLLIFVFIVIYFNKLRKRISELIFPVLTALLLLSPLLIQFIKEPLVVTGRAKTTSVFFNDNIRCLLWEGHTIDGLNGIGVLASRFYHNKFYYYTADIIHRWTSHFSPMFLFFNGDSAPPFKIPNLGYLYLIDLPFFLVGIWFLRRLNKINNEFKKKRLFLLVYLLLSPAVAGLTFMTPAGNRSFNLVIPWTLITAYGLSRILSIKTKNWFRNQIPTPRLTGLGMTIVLISSIYIISFGIYFYSYVITIPKTIPEQWHYGRRELIMKLQPLLSQYDRVYLTNKGGPPYIFLSFYLKIPPETLYETIERDSFIDNLGWGHVNKILNVIIPRGFSWDKLPRDKDALFVGSGNEIPENELKVLDRVKYPDGSQAYVIGALKH